MAERVKLKVVSVRPPTADDLIEDRREYLFTLSRPLDELEWRHLVEEGSVAFSGRVANTVEFRPNKRMSIEHGIRLINEEAERVGQDRRKEYEDRATAYRVDLYEMSARLGIDVD